VDTPPGATVDRSAFIDAQIEFMKVLGEGTASGFVHAKDIKVAEGLRGIDLPPDVTLAQVEWHRKLNDAIVAHSRDHGIDMPDLNAIDQNVSVSSYCFPNFFLLPMYGNASSYRARPLGPEECLFEIWSLTLYPEGHGPPPLPTPKPMGPDDPRWPTVPTQDFKNLPRQQKGLHTRGFEYMRLSSEGEGMIANYHRLIDGYLAGLSWDLLLAAAQEVSGPIESQSRDIGF
jgi:hypothetical protein